LPSPQGRHIDQGLQTARWPRKCQLLGTRIHARLASHARRQAQALDRFASKQMAVNDFINV